MPNYNKIIPKHDILFIDWNLATVCNYKCSYCPEYLHNGSTGFPELDEVEMFCSNVIQHYEGKDICFEFTGGEVTFWKDFEFLVDFLKSHRNVYVGVISNGSQKLEWWKKMRHVLDNVCLSFQPEFSKREHYINLVKMINNFLRTHVNIMMHPDYFNECIEVIEEIVSDVPNVSIALQPLLVGFKDKLYNYTEEQLEIIEQQFEMFGSKVKWTTDFPIFRGAMKEIYKDKVVRSSAHRYISDGTNRWKGWRCYAGVEQIVIDTNGQIWRAWCLEGGSLGFIEDYVELPTEPIICNRDYCHCNFDIMCTKEKI